jgi:hypothetical protein
VVQIDVATPSCPYRVTIAEGIAARRRPAHRMPRSKPFIVSSLLVWFHGATIGASPPAGTMPIRPRRRAVQEPADRHAHRDALVQRR